MVNIAVLLSGGGTNLQALIDAVHGHTIAGTISVVISNRKNAYGLVRARNAGIDTLYLAKKDFPDAEGYDARIAAELQKRDIGLVVLAGYLNILTRPLIAAYPNKIINIHPSLIPAFCGSGFYGLYVHRAVLEKGVRFTGATTHFVDENIDSGAIIMQDVVPVADSDTPESLAQKVLTVEHRILVKTVQAFCSGGISIRNNRVFLAAETAGYPAH